MKNKIRLKKTLLCFALSLVAGISCLLLASCGKQTEKKYDYLVTFDYNVGNIEANCQNQYLGVMKGSRVLLKPGDRNDFQEAAIPGYHIDGWYTAKTDEAGNAEKDEKTGRVLLDEQWDFDTMIVERDITLYANLIGSAEMKYVDVDVYPENPEAEGAVLSVKKDNPGTKKSRPSSALAPKKSGYTLLEYYKDAECTEVFEWPYVVTTEDIIVYVKFIEGEWNVVKNEKEFMQALRSNKNIYLAEDIDFSKAEWAYISYNAELNGNGHKVSNISLKRVCSRNAFNAGLFESLGEKANIHDVTFENAKLEFKVALGDHKAGMLAYEAKAGAKLTNVKISGTLYYDFGGSFASEINPWIAKDESVPENCDYSGVKTEETKIKN